MAQRRYVQGVNLEQNPFETTEQYYKRIAKIADQRLRALEKLSAKDDYKNVKQWAYANAQYDIKALIGENATRFDVKLPKTKTGEIDKRRIEARINAVKRFVLSPTASKRNIDIMYRKEADTLNSKYGTNFTWQQMGDFFQSDTYQKMQKAIGGSDTIVRLIAKIQNNEDGLKDKIEAGDYNSIHVEPEQLQEKTIDFLKENGKDLLNMF